MLPSAGVLALIGISSALANPVIQKRIDLDGNGVPDFCVEDSDMANCMLPDGSWTKVPISGTATTSTTRLTTLAPASTTPSSAAAEILVTGTLPDPKEFRATNGTKWKIEYVGDIKFTDKLGQQNLLGDKCRSSKLGPKVIWNCGDMMCNGGWTVCGFAMGPAFYGTDNVMTINTDGVTHVQDNEFAQAWSGDPQPQAPLTAWGMDTSNVAAINDTHGVAYAREIWRSGSTTDFSDRGNAAVSVTLGHTKPLATRVGPLLTGPNAIELGLLAILRDGDYIYSYSIGGPSNIIVGRVRASDDVFDSSKYQFLQHGSTSTWITGFPEKSTTTTGMTTENTSGQFGCSVYGSAFYSNYFQKYVIICNIYMSYTNMYVSDTPYGPWSAEYSLLQGWVGYGSMAHPEYSPGGSHKELYFSQGPNAAFNMFKLTFNFQS